jgi:hypothetical protein
MLLMGSLLRLKAALYENLLVAFRNWIHVLQLTKGCTVVILSSMILASYTVGTVAVDEAVITVRSV